MEELFHLYLGLVELLKDGLDVADGAVVGGLVVGNSRVPVARQRAGLKLSFEAGRRARTTRVVLRAAEEQTQAQRAQGKCVQHSSPLLAKTLQLLSSAQSLSRGNILSSVVAL